jgi:hypothetical protein
MPEDFDGREQLERILPGETSSLGHTGAMITVQWIPLDTRTPLSIQAT